MKSRVLIIVSLMLLVLVLIGVSVVEPVSENYEWIEPLIPMIVITGFFTFLVSVVLFLYGVILGMGKN